MSANRSRGFPMMAKTPDGHGSAGGSARTPSTTDETRDEAERRQKIGAILEQGERDIAADNGRDWEDVKRRMRERLAARTQ